MIGIKLLSPGLVNGFKWAYTFCGTACICLAATGRASTGTALATWLRRPGIYESVSACALPCQSNVSRLGTETVKHLTVSKEYLWLIHPLPPYFIPKTSIWTLRYAVYRGRATLSNTDRPTCCFTALIISWESLPERIFPSSLTLVLTVRGQWSRQAR